jgi:hypothetical protein
MNLIKAFAEQLAETKPCDGDYLQGKPRDEMLKAWLAHDKWQPSPPPDYVPPNWEDVLNAKIQEWKDHEGDKQVFFMTQTGYDGTSVTIEVAKAWASEIPAMESIWELDDSRPSGRYAMPFLRKKS